MAVSSSPASGLPRSLALVWRTLRSMRTALILLLLLALASVAGSLVPQWPNSPARVLAYRLDHPLTGALYARLGLFDVFGSWWFALITTLLFVSLVACLVPRTRGMIRALRQRPIQAREIDAFPQYRERPVRLAPEAAIAASERALRRRFYRVARDPARPALAAEKGALREAGSLLFHWAFLLILIGVIWGKGTGYTGRAVIVEGDTWVDAAANYDGQIRAGRFFDGRFTGIGVRLVDFEDRYRRTGQPMDFVSRVQLLGSDGAPIGNRDIRVNHPAGVAGLRLYQYGFGWAPVVEVRLDGEPIASEPIVFVQDEAPEGVPQLAMPWRGVLKLPSRSPQLGIELELWPDSRAFVRMLETGQPVAMTGSFQPLIRYEVWSGRLTDPSPLALDTTNMTRRATGIVGADQVVGLLDGAPVEDPPTAGGLTIGFPELRRYTVLQVSRDAGVPLVLLAAILVLVGLLPALYGSRRKIWVRADADGDGAVLKVGGFALQRKARFEEEFPGLVDAMAGAAGGTPATEGEKVGIS
jgi:cytochrome c biogenesis protein